MQPSIIIDTRESFERLQAVRSRDLPDTDESYITLSSNSHDYCIIEPSNPSINSAQVDPTPHQETDKDAIPEVNNEETDNFGQPYTITISDDDLSEYCVVELPSSDDLGVPALNFFPVSHIILNDVDWSLTVVNIGLCVMIYSYQLSNPNIDIKVCTYVYVLQGRNISAYTKVITEYLVQRWSSFARLG